MRENSALMHVSVRMGCYIIASPKQVELVNIRGYSATEQLVDFWQPKGEHFHIDSNVNVHFQQAKEGSVKSEDNFGLYMFRNEAFRCTANSSSTTQHWIGIYHHKHFLSFLPY